MGLDFLISRPAEKTARSHLLSRTWFERAMKDAKIKGFRWHDLRHRAASRLRQKGKLEDIAEFLSHKSLMMTKRYAHLGPTGLQDVVALLEQELMQQYSKPKLALKLTRTTCRVRG
jgi:integrase